MTHFLISHWLEILGTLVGLVYLYLEYKASALLWIAGVVMPVICVFVYYDAGLYADVGINVYYILAAVYGWAMWQFGKKAHGGTYLPITHTPRNIYAPLLIVFAALWGAIGWVLIRFTDSSVPWTDAFTTALSAVGMWLLAYKRIEQWWVWIVVDVVSSALYVYKELYFFAALYALYGVIAVLGYRKWKQLMLGAG